ncbi:MAG TPA: DUF1788 domain-containing protein [Clostridia bacterium]|nr:DUF1788 domain-containing protein [Clostridia bacterium]
MTIDQRLNQIEIEISKQGFLKNRGLGNEVGYYVFDYSPSDELKVREHIERLQRSYKPNLTGYELRVFDIYDLLLDYIEEEGLYDACVKFEDQYGMDYLIRSITWLLTPETKKNYLVDYIIKNTPEKAIVFITGVGKIFPFVRSHNILNKLHQVFDKLPVVLFYPGRYDGQTLTLFSEFEDDHYYRAFPLISIK